MELVPKPQIDATNLSQSDVLSLFPRALWLDVTTCKLALSCHVQYMGPATGNDDWICRFPSAHTDRHIARKSGVVSLKPRFPVTIGTRFASPWKPKVKPSLLYQRSGRRDLCCTLAGHALLSIGCRSLCEMTTRGGTFSSWICYARNPLVTTGCYLDKAKQTADSTEPFVSTRHMSNVTTAVKIHSARCLAERTFNPAADCRWLIEAPRWLA